MAQVPRKGKKRATRARTEPTRSERVDAALKNLGLAPPKAGSGEERTRLLHPTVVGLGGVPEERGPLNPTETKAVIGVVDAVGLDQPDAEVRLERIRDWMLADPTFEQDFWRSMRELARRGVRHAAQLVVRLIYGWHDADDVAKKLGASLDEARSALKTVGETRTMTLEDLAENGITFFRLFRKLKPELWDEVYRRLGMEDDR